MEKEISTLVKIRFADCDPIGHLNNVKYLEYMLNAREDHFEQEYGFTYEEYSRRTGCTWITTQNEIAYLKEVRYNAKVIISSSAIEISDRFAKIEILMKSEDGKIHSVLWFTVIYFNMKTRRSEIHPEDIKTLFKKSMVSLNEKDFQSRVQFFREQNRNN
jgi:acyl-CoA thioester hydrolase